MASIRETLKHEDGGDHNFPGHNPNPFGTAGKSLPRIRMEKCTRCQTMGLDCSRNLPCQQCEALPNRHPTTCRYPSDKAPVQSYRPQQRNATQEISPRTMPANAPFNAPAPAIGGPLGNPPQHQRPNPQNAGIRPRSLDQPRGEPLPRQEAPKTPPVRSRTHSPQSEAELREAELQKSPSEFRELMQDLEDSRAYEAWKKEERERKG